MLGASLAGLAAPVFAQDRIHAQAIYGSRRITLQERPALAEANLCSAASGVSVAP